MAILPLPVFEADADPARRSVMSDEEIYARLTPPKTIVVRFGYLKIVGEFGYDGDAKPGCGSKLVVRTLRGTEIAEMLTTTCSNSGCGKSVSRREMLDYIENSGGKDFPFHTTGRVLRVATIEDLNNQSALETTRREAVKFAKAQVVELNLPMKIVEAEPLLGGELITFYYMSEARIDFRELVNRLAGQFHTRIEMRQVGSRDEARLVADYERCGQHCCCKNFLKVLKPVSMRAAKQQKATLDPLKISGRCGRLMCCLRYEDQTYKELKSNLPPKNKRVGTSEGPGVVIDGKILVQLVLVRLEHDGKEIAVPVEELMDPEKCPKPRLPGEEREEDRATSDPLRGMSEKQVRGRTDIQRRGKPPREREGKSERGGKPRREPRPDRAKPADAADAEFRTKEQQQDAFREQSQQLEPGDAPPAPAEQSPGQGEPGQRDRKRRRRGRGRGKGGNREGQGEGRGQGSREPRPESRRDGNAPHAGPTGDGESPADGAGAGQGGGQGGGDGPRKKRRRRRGGRAGRGGQGGSGGGAPGPSAG